jgi:hypothetical protein
VLASHRVELVLQSLTLFNRELLFLVRDRLLLRDLQS